MIVYIYPIEFSPILFHFYNFRYTTIYLPCRKSISEFGIQPAMQVLRSQQTALRIKPFQKTKAADPVGGSAAVDRCPLYFNPWQKKIDATPFVGQRLHAFKLAEWEGFEPSMLFSQATLLIFFPAATGARFIAPCFPYCLVRKNKWILRERKQRRSFIFLKYFL